MKKLIKKLFLLICLTSSFAANAQLHVGFHNLTLIADLSFATPKNEMANYYSIGDAMKLYAEGGISFLEFQYSKGSSFNLEATVFLGYENANFDPADYVSNGLDARLTTFGLRLKPLYLNESNDVLSGLISGVYVEIGQSSALLIEPGQPDVIRLPFVVGYGIAPAISLSSKTKLIFDFGFRSYNWINNSHTTSTISTFRTGMGLQFNL